MPITALGGPIATNGSSGNLDAAHDGGAIVLINSRLYRIDVGGEMRELVILSGNMVAGQVEVLSDGRYLVTATEHSGLGAGNQFQIFNADGSAVGPVQRMTDFDGVRGGAHAEALSGGGFLVTYDDLDNGTNPITFADGSGSINRDSDMTWRTFDAAGNGSTSRIAWTGVEDTSGAVTDRTSMEQSSADSAQLAGGGLVIAYRDQRVVGAFNSQGDPSSWAPYWTISVQVGTAGGGFGHPIQVNTDPFDLVPNQAGDVSYPVQADAMNSVIALNDGGFAVIWHEQQRGVGNAFEGWNTQIRYFNADGSARTGEITIAHRDDDYGNLSKHVRAEVLPDGRIVFAYTDGVSGVNGNGEMTLFMGILSVNGGVSELTQISPTAANGDFFSLDDLVVRSDGTVDVAYYNDRTQYIDGVYQPGTQQMVIQRFGVSGLGYNAIGGTDGANALNGTAAIDLIVAGGGADRLNGLAANDRLFGGAGNDVIDGGLGGDRMEGGSGDDAYYVDAAGDTVVEAASAGVDRIFSTLTRTLGANIENLTLIGSADINGTGNDLANLIGGNSGNNVLNGLAGADVMAGGLGDDTYHVDVSTDRVVEAAGAGTDKVFSSISWTLGAEVETLTLTGTAAINGTGNALVNLIGGNTGANLLDGKAGADVMAGGLGNDTYVVDVAGDRAVEAVSAGTDTVRSSVAWTLGADIENLTLTGSAAVNATGNVLNNVIVGNSGANVIVGGGGRDTMTGGAGIDRFDFNATTESTSAAYDWITDLTDADVIDLSTIDANAGLAGNQAFVLVDAFSNQAGQVMLTYSASNDFTILSADVNGDGVADMRIVLNGDHEDFTNFSL